MKVRLVLASIAITAAMGCATQGVGNGELEPAVPYAGPVVFRWKSDGPSATRGKISAVLPDGESFVGEYRQPTSTPATFGSNWRTTEPGLYRPPNANGAPNPYFIEGVPTDHVLPSYSGRLLARLRAPDGTVMTCSFHLHRPHYGPAAGASGRCVLSSGKQIEDVKLG